MIWLLAFTLCSESQNGKIGVCLVPVQWKVFNKPRKQSDTSVEKRGCFYWLFWSSTTGYKLQIWIQFITQTHTITKLQKALPAAPAIVTVMSSVWWMWRALRLSVTGVWTCSWFLKHAAAVHVTLLFIYSLTQRSLHHVADLFKLKSRSLVTVRSPQLFSPIWVMKLFRDPEPTTPSASIPSRPWAGPSQFFLAFVESYFLLLEYQRSRGMPMEGRVITPNAAQSSWKTVYKWSEVSTVSGTVQKEKR